MNTTNSLRAFIITALLFGVLYLVLYSVKLTYEEEAVLENYDLEYAEEISIDSEEENTSSPTSQIETNKAYNEAEAFIKNLETERASEEITKSTPNESTSNTNESGLYDTSEIEKAKQKIKETKQKLANNALKKPTNTGNGISKKTTISYRLVNRKAIALPNPVYTCDAGGKIVITIEVDALGKVQKWNYNKNLSTTTNGCLIESALKYAARSRFTTLSGKAKQLGTITYYFPGKS